MLLMLYEVMNIGEGPSLYKPKIVFLNVTLFCYILYQLGHVLIYRWFKSKTGPSS